jgi:signal transduction histidine kinase
MTAELERAEQQRRNITADIAHELRTPLHIIQGNLEGVLDGVYEPTPEHLGATLEETHRLTRLINDLQTLSLAEAGQLPLHLAPLLAGDLLEAAGARFAGPAAEAGLSLSVAPGLEDLWLYGDADRLEQVLTNLVGNALRHTAAGGTVALRAVPADDRVLLSVSDTGAGIAPEALPFVFDRFWRGDKARTGSANSGLGLAISRQLAQSHGGTIRVESELGQGTTFTIDLPRHSPD